jgi:hypothetical protein
MMAARKPSRSKPVPAKPVAAKPAGAVVAEPAPAILGALPEGLRQELTTELNKVERSFREGNWEQTSLDAGRLCEIVYSIVRGHVDGSYPAQASKPPDMVAACHALENLPAADWKRSIRIHIPRVLLAAYEIRNNRDVGHVGGEVDSNHMDASLALALSKWLVAELVRTFHQVDTETATAYVDSLVERQTSLVWSVAGRKRVLNPSLSYRDKTLLLLHATATPVPRRALCEWTEYSNPYTFWNEVLPAMHAEKLIEFDKHTDLVYLSPTGIRYVEGQLPTWML